MFNPNTTVDTRVAVLEEKFSVYEQMMTKMESAIHTISEAYQGISKMLAIHEQRIETGDNADSLILEAIKKIENNNSKEHEKVIKKIEDLENKFQEKDKEQDQKIEGLVKFRWLFGGALLLTAFLFTQQQINFFGNLQQEDTPAIIKPAN